MTRPTTSLTVDIVVLSMRQAELSVLLVERKYEPFQGRWALPGGFVEAKESLEQAAVRELGEETGVSGVYMEQLFSFGDPGRDPRGHVVTVAYLALLPSDLNPKLSATTDAREARWFPMSELPELAFDHAKILSFARERLKNKLEYTTAGFKLLPEQFTLTDLQQTYESVLQKTLDKRNFRRKIGLLGVLTPTKAFRREGVSRPAKLYRFSAKRFEKIKDKGILFPF